MEEQVSSHISDLEGLNSELEGFLADLHGREQSLSARVTELEAQVFAAKDRAASELLRFAQNESSLEEALEGVRSTLSRESSKVQALTAERENLDRRLDTATRMLEEAKAALADREELLKEARISAREKAAEFSAGTDQLKASVADADLRAEAAAAEREALKRQVDAVERLLEGEKARSIEKEQLINSGRAALKAKEEEIDKILRGVEELKADLALERSSVKDREAQLQKAARMQEGLEKRLEQAVQENSRSEEGFLLKVELVKKELREQARRGEDLERKLAAAGARLEDALEEAAGREKILSEVSAALADKEAQLKDANHKLKELTREFSEISSGKLQETAARARESAAAMSARVEELENSLSETSTRHLEKFRAVQAELGSVKADLRAREEENSALRAREETISKELGDAEEKWKFATAQLNSYASRLRNSENELEISRGHMKSLEEERDKFRAAAIKAETAASSMAAQESRARDGEAAGLMAALEEQAAKYNVLLRKYDDLILLNEGLARDRSAARTEADSLRDALRAAQAQAEAEVGEKLGVKSGLAEKLRAVEAQLKNREYELNEARSEAAAAALYAEDLRTRLEQKEDSAAGEAEAERARYALLSEKMHNAEVLLKKKEFELDEAREALSTLDKECGMLRASRAALGEKYAREIQAENELLKEAQARIVQRDSLISRLSMAEDELKKEAEALRKEKQSLISLVRKKSSGAQLNAKVAEAERMLAEKESRLVKLRSELENTRAEKAELQGREKELSEELKARPYRAMLREAEEKLLIKEKMVADMGSRMQRIGRDFEDLKARGHSAGAPGYLPEFEELVAGVAHQVANSISIIRSHAEFCSEAPDSAVARESLDVIVRNIVNLQKKIDIIMNFSRPVIPQRSPERLNRVLAEVVEGLKASGRLEGVTVKVKGGEKLNPVSLDRVRFASAVEQLLLNAAEAMPAGGEISVSLSGAEGRQRLEVADAGNGIEKKNLGSVFHPFFTTKPGRMGLGLTLARNVARAHGGTLELVSEPGRGARAVLELPGTT